MFKMFSAGLIFCGALVLIVTWLITLPLAGGDELLKRPAALASIQVDITTHLGDRQTFKAGDAVSFLLSLDRDAYLTVIYQSTDGALTLLIPNRQLTNSFYQAGLFISLLGEHPSLEFKVQAPFGKETVWVFASDAPIPELEGLVLENGLKRLNGDIASIKHHILAHSQAAFGESRLSLQTRGID